jgi:hypothetical protein
LKVFPTSYQITCTGAYPNQNAYAHIKGYIETPVPVGNKNFKMTYTWEVYDTSSNSYLTRSGYINYKGPLSLENFEIKNIAGGMPSKTGAGSVTTFCLLVDDVNIVEETNEFNNRACFSLLYSGTKDCNPKTATLDASNVTWSK